MRVVLRVLAALCVLGPGSVVAAPAAVAQQSQDTSPEVELVESGSSPRDVLRLAPPVGASESSTITMRFHIEQSGVSDLTVNPPPFRAAFAAALPDVTPEGNLHVTFSYPSFEVLQRKGTSESERRRFKDALDNLAGLSGEYTLTTQGAVVDSKLNIPPGLDPAIAESLEQLTNQLGVLQAPLPEPPVGLGARWRATTNQTSNGIQIRQVAQYTLNKRTDAVVELGIRGTQSAKPQTIESPEVPAGAELRLTKLKTTLRGNVTLNLNSVLGQDGQVRASSNQTVDVRAGDESGKVHQQIDFDVSLKPE
jgi:hypothetical protein